jgi:DNA-binding NtrC family response regulator
MNFSKSKGDFATAGTVQSILLNIKDVLPLKIPPLRRRKEDIMSIATVFYNELFRGRPPVKAEKYFRDIKEHLMEYEWPGNIRELRNVIEYLWYWREIIVQNLKGRKAIHPAALVCFSVCPYGAKTVLCFFP